MPLISSVFPLYLDGSAFCSEEASLLVDGPMHVNHGKPHSGCLCRCLTIFPLPLWGFMLQLSVQPSELKCLMIKQSPRLCQSLQTWFHPSWGSQTTSWLMNEQYQNYPFSESPSESPLQKVPPEHNSKPCFPASGSWTESPTTQLYRDSESCS